MQFLFLASSFALSVCVLFINQHIHCDSDCEKEVNSLHCKTFPFKLDKIAKAKVRKPTDKSRFATIRAISFRFQVTKTGSLLACKTGAK